MDYESNIIKYFRHQESKRYRLHFLSPQKYRGDLVMKIISVANSLKLSETTLHMAVYILDIYMDCHNIAFSRLELVCFACISVAAKYEERDENTPKVSELLPHMSEQPWKGHFLKMEFCLLNFLNWKFFPTSVHFAEYFVQYALCQDDLMNFNVSKEELRISLRRQMKIYLRLTLLDERILKKSPSIIGAACVAAAREKLHLFPTWPPNMKDITGYKHLELSLYSRMLIMNEESRWRGTKEQDESACCQGCGCSCHCDLSNAVDCSHLTRPLPSSSTAQPPAPVLSLSCNVGDKHHFSIRLSCE